MHNNFHFKTLFFLASFLFFVSCDKDFNEVGSDLIGDSNFELKNTTYSVVAYNEKITPVQSANLPVNALGIYNNPAFGKTTANFATQLTLAAENPTFTTINMPPAIDSVYLSVPYFTDVKAIPITSGGATYELDSIYGEPKAKIKLSIYESGRYMGTQNAIPQTFYSNQNSVFNDFKVGSRLNDDIDKSQNDEFFFDAKQHIETTIDAATKKTNAYIAPGMRLKLNTTFFKDKIFNAPAGSLAANDVFINYFKGLYFKVDESGSDHGSLSTINFAKGKITIYYKEDNKTKADDPQTADVDETVVERVSKTIVLNMTGNTVSLLEQSSPNSGYETAINNPNRTLGDQKLYLKGGVGSLAVVKLFDNIEDLENIRKNKWLINEAHLIFNVDVDKMKNSHEPERLFLYDFTNNTPILDFVAGTATANKNTSRFTFGGYIKRDATTLKRGVSYKINITNHIRSLVKFTASENIKLGLVVTEDINVAGFNLLQTKNDFISQTPKSSVMNPLGTILYGSGTDVPEDKKLKLEIYYTIPK